MAKTWERVDRVDGWILIEDLLALSDLALTLIEQALEPLEPLYRATFKDGGRASTSDRAEFREDLAGSNLTDLEEASFIHGSAETLMVAVGLREIFRPQTSLRVSGRNRTNVEGIYVQIGKSSAIDGRSWSS